MNILGLDYGKKRIGLAIADEEARLATPFSVIENKGDSFVIEELGKIIVAENINKVVVGLPLSLKEGEGNELVNEVYIFVEELRKGLGLPVETEDERYTSEQTRSLFAGQKNKKANKDTVAAMIILQSYLDRGTDLHR